MHLWLEDLEQVRAAISTKYADLEWDVLERGVNLNAVFAQARARLQQAHSNATAREIFDDLAQQFGDRHVGFYWPALNAPAALGPGPAISDRPTTSCAGLGYDVRMQSAPLASLLPGFVPISSAIAEFPAGLVIAGTRKVGIVKIPLFSPLAFPVLCETAIATLRPRLAEGCDEACKHRIDSWASNRMTQDFEIALDSIRAAGADALLIDISGNGGGSEWAEAAARMVTSVRLQASQMWFMKGPHWVERLARKQAELRAAAQRAHGEDRSFLNRLAGQVAERQQDAGRPCDGGPLWTGMHPDCQWLGDGFYSTGLLQSAGPDNFRSKPWGKLVFTPLQYPYHEGIWRGPLLVLVDSGTGSAAEQFAAELQDNHAAVVIGSPTVGAGCGHTDGGTPTPLTNSHAILKLPDCLRMRTSGLNLASGIQPDVLVGLRENDSPQRRARLLADKLPQALQMAVTGSE